jgi:hypothetical protein
MRLMTNESRKKAAHSRSWVVGDAAHVYDEVQNKNGQSVRKRIDLLFKEFKMEQRSNGTFKPPPTTGLKGVAELIFEVRNTGEEYPIAVGRLASLYL